MFLFLVLLKRSCPGRSADKFYCYFFPHHSSYPSVCKISPKGMNVGLQFCSTIQLYNALDWRRILCTALPLLSLTLGHGAAGAGVAGAEVLRRLHLVVGGHVPVVPPAGHVSCHVRRCHVSRSPDIVESGEVSAVELFPGWNAHSFLGALGLRHSRDVNKNTKKKGCIFSLHDLFNNVLQILINCHRRLNASDKSCIFVQP